MTVLSNIITPSNVLTTTNTATVTNKTFGDNPTFSAGTANGVTYLNGSKVLTSGSALVFDGTNFSTSGTSTASKLIPTGTSVTGNGMYLPATNSLGFSTAGVNAAYIDANQNVGIGVTPSAWRSSFNVTYGERALELTYSALVTQAGPNTILANNVYFNSSNQWIYKNAVANTNAGLYTIGSNGVHSWSVAPTGASGAVATFTQAMTLGSDGNLAVGTTSTSGARLKVDGGATSGTIGQFGNAQGGVILGAASSVAYVDTTSSTPLAFNINGTERARIDSSGNLLVGTTNTNPGGSDINGIALRPGNFTVISALGTTPFGINRGTDDGVLINLSQAGSTEGTISVSGTTVSYNGGHLSRWAQMLTKPELFKGTVMSNLDEMNVYTKDGQPVDNEQLNKVKVSDTEGDANVAGVFVNWSHDDDHNVDEINMAMTGDMIIRIAQGVTVVRGDLLMSAGDGTAKPQGDDIIRSKTVAKVTSNHVTCTYADGSYCVPCVLMAC